MFVKLHGEIQGKMAKEGSTIFAIVLPQRHKHIKIFPRIKVRKINVYRFLKNNLTERMCHGTSRLGSGLGD